MSLCQDADLPFYIPLIAATLSVAYNVGGRVADAVPRCPQVLEQTTATRKPVYEEVLSGLKRFSVLPMRQ